MPGRGRTLPTVRTADPSVPEPAGPDRLDDSDWASRARAVVAGGTSTGSKRPDAMFGPGTHGPSHYASAHGCRLTTTDGTELIDCTMALGAVGFGYADPEVTEAVIRAARAGNVSGLAHTLEVTVAEQLCALIPFAEQVRFLKTGAEAVAAAVRIARVRTGRSRVLACGYFGWLDWNSDAPGVPDGTRRTCDRIPFGDVDAAYAIVREMRDDLAAIVVEPVIERHAPVEWLRALRDLCDRTGALLIVDEIKTGFRVHVAGAMWSQGVRPDLAVYGKALANGYPLAAVVGNASVMHAVHETWISSTLATETTALAAASVVLHRHAREDVCARLAEIGAAMRGRVERGLRAQDSSEVALDGIAPMWFLRFADPAVEARALHRARAAGVLLKRGAYNFSALAHDAAALTALEGAITAAIGSGEAADA